MAYITRKLERMFLKLNDFFKVILDRYLGMREIYKSPWIRMIRISTGRINWK